MIGERLKTLREERGYSLTKLADLAGVSKSYLSYLERDLRDNPSLQFLSKIADALDVTLEYLIGMEYANTAEKELDAEWKELIDSLDRTMTRDDLEAFREFLEYKNWSLEKK